MKERIIKNKRQIFIFIAIFLPIAAFYLTVGCPLRFFTGICCPGCGMSRALVCLLKFDFTGAYNMHPLIFIMPAVALIYIFRNKLPRKLYVAIAALFFISMAVTYIYRLQSGSEIVYIDPSRGFIIKSIQFISGGM